jgi:hypothetical protein
MAQRIKICVVPFTGFRRLVHSFSTGSLVGGLAVLLIGVGAALPAAAQSGSATLFRIFMTDGRVLTAYGEWARLDDRIVFSMPTRRGDPAGELHIVTVPAGQVDWERTERYATAIRAQNYAATRGEADFAQLSDEVARTLNAIATIKDPAERLAHAEQARRTLNQWPSAHFGYRAAEVREILGMLDEVILDLRAAAGASGTALALIAPPPMLPDEPLLPEPTESEMVEQWLTAADLAATPAERSSLLQTLLGLLDRAADLLPPPWAKLMRARAESLLADEQRLDRAYAELRTTTLAAATRSAMRADVRGIEKLRGAVREADARLGGKRPAEIEGLLATLDVQLDSARAVQLARDQWELRAPGIRRYRRAVTLSLRAISRTTPALEDVRSQAGPAARRLPSIIDRWRKDGRRLDRITPPADLQAVHALFRSAWEMAEQAFTLRLSAAAGNDASRAQQASSAAAGALMLLARARADLDAASARPTAAAP